MVRKLQLWIIEEYYVGIEIVPPGVRKTYQYKFQNKEWQDELNLNVYDFGARQYMPDIVRTTTIDPLAEKFYSLSPQSFLNNNPLYFIDPAGMSSFGFDWKPDEDGNLIAEKGDNTATLATYLGTTTKDVSNRFTLKSTGERLPENYEFKEGAKVVLNNNMSQDVKQYKNTETVEMVSCHEVIYPAVTGAEINDKGTEKTTNTPLTNSGLMDGQTFKEIKSEFTKISNPEEAVFGKTVAVFGAGTDNEHSAVFYGTSKDGTRYYYSKNGQQGAPSIRTEKSLMESYGGSKEIQYFNYTGRK